MTQFEASKRALPNQDIVRVRQVFITIFQDEFTVNPLAGKFTTKEIAEGLGERI